VAAISNELYVVNDESLVAFCLLSVFWAVGKYGGPAYAEWASAQSQKIKDILNSARADHTQAVRERIDSVSQLGTVVDITKDLFAVSKVRTTRLNLWIVMGNGGFIFRPGHIGDRRARGQDL